ncbi:MAG TPA: TolC family protein [Spirochaetota bacterium]|nr:TolC family protein [Spirochaetota bacterium]
MTRTRRTVATVYALLVFILPFPAQVSAGPADLQKIFRDVTGTGPADLKESSGRSVLTLYDAYILSLHKGEGLAIAGEDFLQAAARRRQAFGSFLPRISLKAQKIFPEDNVRNQSAVSGSGVSLYARQPIITGLDEWSAFKLARSDMAFRRMQIGEAANVTLLDVARSFYQLLQVEFSLKNREKVIGLHRRMLAELNRRVAVGRSRRSEVLKTLSQVAMLEAEVQSLKNMRERAVRDFQTITNTPPGKKIADYVSIDDPPPLKKAEDALTRRWDIKSSEYGLEIAEAKLCAARGGHLPSLYLEGAYRLYQENSTGSRDYYVGLGAELPLFSGGITSARVSEAESLVQQAKLRKSLVTRRALQDITDALEGYRSSGEEAVAYRKALDAAERNYGSTVREYGLNLVTILDVLTSLTLLRQTRDEYERMVLQHRLDRIRLGVATGEFIGKGVLVLKNAVAGTGKEGGS